MKIIPLFIILTLLGCKSEEEARQYHLQTVETARQFAQGFESVKRVSCSRRDSDWNGYYSCTVFLPKNEFRELECNPDGCKIKEKKEHLKIKQEKRSIRTTL